jgi:peroxiredoxin
MKNLLPLVLLAFLLACQTTEKNNYQLTGEVASPDGTMVYLQDRIAGVMVPVDSALVENGIFSFSGQLEYPEIYYIRIDGIQPLFSVFIENADISLEIDIENPADFTVTGSRSHDIFKGVNSITLSHDEQLRDLQQQTLSAEVIGNTAEANQLREQYKAIEQQRKQQIKDYVAQYPGEHAAVFVAMRQLAHGLNAEELSQLVDLFDPSLQGARYYDDLRARIAVLEKVAIGKPAIDFTLPDPENNELALSDLRGKYVLINFWASWCPYCRQENPHLVDLYRKYQSENFEILGVSLDRTHEAWVKGINEDGLLWPQVSDLKGWNSGPAAEYAVRSIPQNVLVDPDGIIIDRNLKDKELEQRLEHLLSPV